MNDIVELLEDLRRETQPVDGHTDPKAIEDVWNMVFEAVASLKAEPVTSEQLEEWRLEAERMECR